MTQREFYRSGTEVCDEAMHYTMSGLEDIYLLNGFKKKETPYGSGITISDIDGLHKAIGLSLIMDRKTLMPTELRFLRKEMKLTQAELAQRLGLSDQQVARWEKGESEISGPADKLIRIFYALELVPARQRASFLNKLTKSIKALTKADETSTPKLVLKETEDGWAKAA